MGFRGAGGLGLLVVLLGLGVIKFGDSGPRLKSTGNILKWVLGLALIGLGVFMLVYRYLGDPLGLWDIPNSQSG